MTTTININVTGPVYVQQLSDADRDFIRASLSTLLQGNTKMSAQLDALTSEVSQVNTVIDSAIALIQGLKAALDAAGTDPAALQALSDSLDAKAKQLAQAVADNTPAAQA